MTSKEQLFDRLVHYANIAGAKLRKRGLWTRDVGVYIQSSPFKKDSYNSNFMNTCLNAPTQDTRDIVSGIKIALERIYKSGIGYKKSRILLGDLTSHGDVTQLTLDHQVTHAKLPSEQGRGVSEPLMAALDNLNQRYGRHTVSVGTIPHKTKTWQGSRSHTSPKYTTKWSDLPKV